jgi:hypothetical protein
VWPVIFSPFLFIAWACGFRQRSVTLLCFERKAPNSDPMAPAPSIIMLRGRCRPPWIFVVCRHLSLILVDGGRCS